MQEIFEELNHDINLTFKVEKGSKLCHIFIQKNNSIKYDISIEEDAEYNLFLVQLGECRLDNDIKINLNAPNATADINIAYKIDQASLIKNKVLINHNTESTFSNQLIKGVLSDRSFSDFNGKIHISHGADKSNGHMLHKSLLLSDAAKANILPELEIFADDVKCSHGAATGVIDEMQLFYMTSRGIEREDAKQMLIDAYLDDVFNKICNNDIYELIKSRIK